MGTAAQLTAVKHALFFAELEKHGQITRAARVASLDRASVYELRTSNPEFNTRWVAALDTYADKLEAAAHERAVEGTKKPIVHQGQFTYEYKRDPDGRPLKDDNGNYVLDLDENGQPKVAYVREYSDTLLALMLKAKRKREYGDSSKVELTGADGGPVAIEETPTQIARKIAFALALGLRNKEQQLEDGMDLA